MSERTMGPGGTGHGGTPNAPGGAPEAPAPTAAQLAQGRHDANVRPDGGRPDGRLDGAGGPRGEETTTVYVPGGDHNADQGPPPPWQRATHSGGPSPAGGSKPGPSGVGSEPAATTEVYRPAVGVNTAVVEPGLKPPPGPAPGGPGGPGPGGPGGPSGPSGPGGPGGQPPHFAPPGPGPGNGQLPNPFGGSSGPDVKGHHGGNPRPPAGRPTARPTAPVRGRIPRAPRKASLQIRRFDPWSVLKLSLVLSVAMFLMWLVAVGVLYGVLNGMGVWDKLNGAWNDLASVNEAGGESEQLISAGRVFGISAVVGAINIVLFTAFATVLAFVYNVSADLAGGVEVTLSERD